MTARRVCKRAVALVLAASRAFALGSLRRARSLLKHDGKRLEAHADPRLVFAKHPLLGGLPVPSSPEGIAAAKTPDYVRWAAESASGSSSNGGGVHAQFLFSEHAFLGDSLILKGPDGADLPPRYIFTLPNGLTLSYGEISSLGGDFYGTYRPISDGATLEERIDRFHAAYALLATETTRQPAEARAILAVAADERAAFSAALANGTEPSAAYADLPDKTLALQLITLTRPPDQPGYLGIAAINFDHFGADARLAYDAGHTAALRAAVAGDLLGGYALNAFADHFLQDSFAAGHLRTPRRRLHGTLTGVLGGPADLCAKYMHDEDNALGLEVSSPSGDRWTVYGDSYLLDKAGLPNMDRAFRALQISAAEVYAAYEARAVVPSGAFGAWSVAPTLESASGGPETQALAPLFDADGRRRADLADRRSWRFTSWYTYITTILQIEFSGEWDYPLAMD